MDDDDMGAMYASMKQASQEKRANNRDNSAALLTEQGIIFTSHNLGAHLVVCSPVGLIDFWPGTGKYIIRRTKKSARGVHSLIGICKPK